MGFLFFFIRLGQFHVVKLVLFDGQFDELTIFPLFLEVFQFEYGLKIVIRDDLNLISLLIEIDKMENLGAGFERHSDHTFNLCELVIFPLHFEDLYLPSVFNFDHK